MKLYAKTIKHIRLSYTGAIGAAAVMVLLLVPSNTLRQTVQYNLTHLAYNRLLFTPLEQGHPNLASLNLLKKRANTEKDSPHIYPFENGLLTLAPDDFYGADRLVERNNGVREFRRNDSIWVILYFSEAGTYEFSVSARAEGPGQARMALATCMGSVELYYINGTAQTQSATFTVSQSVCPLVISFTNDRGGEDDRNLRIYGVTVEHLSTPDKS